MTARATLDTGENVIYTEDGWVPALAEGQFCVRWPAELGPAWLNADNILTCIRKHCAGVPNIDAIEVNAISEK